MFVPCSSYDAQTVAKLHDLFSGPLGVLTVACIGISGLLAGSRVIARGQVRGTRVAALVAGVAIALGGLFTWGSTRFGATTAECRGEGDGGWGGRQLTWTLARKGIPAFVVSTSTEGDSQPTQHVSTVSAIADVLFWAGIAASLAAWVITVRSRPRSRSPNTRAT